MTTKISFSISPDRDWDYITFKGMPADTKFDAVTRQKLAKANIYWSFKRSQYYSKGRIDAAVVQSCLKGHSFLPLKGTAGYVAPTPKAKAAPKSTGKTGSTEARLSAIEQTLALIADKLSL